MIGEKGKFVENKYTKDIMALWKFVNESIKSSVMNRIETLIDGSAIVF